MLSSWPTQKVGSAANLEFHSTIVAQKFVQRELIRASGEILARSYDESEELADLLNYAQQEIFKVSEGHISKEVQNSKSLIGKTLDIIAQSVKNGGKINGVPTGFTQLDEMTLGWQPSDLIIIAARPSMGKTAFVLSMARNITVTEGKGAMGDALIRLRYEGKLYSGRGLSTDIIGAAIRAYVSALNKIVYDQNNSK